MKRSPGDSLVRVLGSPALVVFVILLSALLASPSLTSGYSSDDHIQRMWVKGEGRCLDLFNFADGDEALMRLQKIGGAMPWYADSGLKISFFRPLASLSHCVDYRYLDAFPALLHFQNLLWLGAAIFATSALYRRTASAPFVAVLATLLFAIDEAHGGVVGWLANRNTLMATTFGMLAVGLHHRARLEGSRKSAFFAPLAFLAALLSAEAGLSALAYIASHALFLDKGRPRERLRALWPYAVVLVVWKVAYLAFDHGQYGSALYTSPTTEPLRFLSAVVERAPVLLFAQLGGPPSDAFTMAKAEARHSAWLVSAVSLSLVATLFFPLLRRRKQARFFAFGMLLSVVPACATVPRDRLLMLVGVGGMGLVAEFLSSIVEAPPSPSRHWLFRAPAYALSASWLFVHGLLAPYRLPGTSVGVAGFGDYIAAASQSLFADIEPQSGIVVLSGDNMYACNFASFLGYSMGHAKGSVAQCLAAGEGKVSILRIGNQRLVVKPEGGFIDRAREPFWNAAKPMKQGDVIDVGWHRITVTEVSKAGEPLEAMFHFAASLDDPKMRLRHWSQEQARYVDSPRLPIWGRLTIEGGEVVAMETPKAR